MRTEFYGFPVYASRHLGESTHEFWLRPKSPAKRWRVQADLAKHPGLVRWDRVLIDAGLDSSSTRLFGWRGREDNFPGPERGFTGVVYLQREYAEERGLVPPVTPDLKHRSGRDRGKPLGMPYEFQMVVYWDRSQPLRDGRRYYGFHARIIKVDGPEALVTVFHAGTSLYHHRHQSETPALTRWMKLNDRTEGFDLDVSHGGLTEIEVSNEKKWEGALFIHRDLAAQLKLKLKMPGSLFLIGKLPDPLLAGIAHVEIP